MWKEIMSKKLSSLLLSILAMVLMSAGCVRTAATWQPGQITAATNTTPATVDYDYTVGMLRLTPAQNGAAIPVNYAITDSGDGINCKITFDQLSAGDSGAISWTLKNISNVDGEFSVKASITASNGAPIATASDDINIKLKRNNAYIVGDIASYANLAKLIPVLNSQLENKFSGETFSYELDWQKNTLASHNKTTGKITLSVTFTLLESQSNH
jgi:hypothetical protein